MKARSALGLSLLLVSAAACGGVPESPQLLAPMQLADLQPGWMYKGEKSNVRSSREVLDVGWEHHGGYFLDHGQGSEMIVPEFADAAIRRVFDDFFQIDNLSLHWRKRIRCECAGEYFERNGVEFFLVREARIFAE